MDYERILASLVAALAINELLHNIFEIWSARQKVSWLHSRIKVRPHGAWPFNIDTLSKTIGLHTLLFVIVTGIPFAIFLTLNLSIGNYLTIAVVALVVTYSFTTLAMDGYHTDIGRLLKRF